MPDIDLLNNSRVINALPSASAAHYVTRGELEGVIAAISSTLYLLTSGGNAMAGDLDMALHRVKRLAVPQAPDDAARLADTGLPVATVLPWAGTAILSRPGEEWHALDGVELVQTSYPELFGKIGTTYGTSNPATLFKLPDARGRTIIATGTGPIFLPHNPIALTSRSIGDKGGEEVHDLSVSELPPHHHRVSNSSGNQADGGAGVLGINGAGGALETLDTGDGAPHNNMQPWLALHVIMRIK